MTRAKIVLLLALLLIPGVALCELADDDQAEKPAPAATNKHVIKIHRPPTVGVAYRISIDHLTVLRNKLVMDGEKISTKETDHTVLNGELEVLDLDDKGQAARMRLTIAELEPAVVRASRYFDEHSGAPLDDPRTTLVLDDARAVLQRSGPPYDVIVSEPSWR